MSEPIHDIHMITYQSHGVLHISGASGFFCWGSVLPGTVWTRDGRRGTTSFPEMKNMRDMTAAEVMSGRHDPICPTCLQRAAKFYDFSLEDAQLSLIK